MQHDPAHRDYDLNPQLIGRVRPRPRLAPGRGRSVPNAGAAPASGQRPRPDKISRNAFAQKFEQLVRPICTPSYNSWILFSTSPHGQ